MFGNRTISDGGFREAIVRSVADLGSDIERLASSRPDCGTLCARSEELWFGTPSCPREHTACWSWWSYMSEWVNTTLGRSDLALDIAHERIEDSIHGVPPADPTAERAPRIDLKGHPTNRYGEVAIVFTIRPGATRQQLLDRITKEVWPALERHWKRPPRDRTGHRGRPARMLLTLLWVEGREAVTWDEAAERWAVLTTAWEAGEPRPAALPGAAWDEWTAAGREAEILTGDALRMATSGARRHPLLGPPPRRRRNRS